MNYATACSGIDAPGTAWKTLGWRPVFHAEIEPFPRTVLAHHDPDVPNLGNMEAITREQIEGFKPVSVFVAGTPCQSFSVAGLRKGMADPRGNLALVFLRLVDWLRPTWVVWENVPGVHSSWSDVATFAPSEGFRRDLEEVRRLGESAGLDLGTAFDPDNFEEADQSSDFDCFLSGLEELGYGIATKVFDAQHFGVPQRRNRVFVVGHLGGDWQRAAAVLLERFSLSGNPAPSREAGARVAACLTRGAESSGKGGYAGRRREDDFNIVGALDSQRGGADDNSAQAGHLIASTGDVSHCLNAGGMGRQDYETETLIAHSLRGDGFDASEDGTGRGTPIVPVGFTIHGTDKTVSVASACDVAGSLRTKPPGSVENSSSTVVLQPQAFQCQGSNVGPMGTMRKGNGDITGGVPFVFQTRCSRNGRGMPSEVAGALTSCEGGTHADTKPHVSTQSGVRRLMPIECERLQGFPDGHTAIAHCGKPAKDAPRYKAIGNSMAVPVLTWIGNRIEAVEAIPSPASPAPRKAESL